MRQWDDRYSVVDNEYDMHQLEALSKARGYRDYFTKAMRKHKEQGVPIYETVFWSHNVLNSGLAIIPTRNMICNSGISDDAEHFSGEMKTIPRRMRKLLTMKSYDVVFPLRHPRYVIENVEYHDRVYRIMGWGKYSWVKVGRSIEELFNNLRYGNIRQIKKAAVKRLKKLTGRNSYN